MHVCNSIFKHQILKAFACLFIHTHVIIISMCVCFQWIECILRSYIVCMLWSCVNYVLLCVSVRFYMTSTKSTSYYNSYYMPMLNHNKYQLNLPIGLSNIRNVRKLHNIKVPQLYLPSPMLYPSWKKNLCSHVFPLNTREWPPSEH